MENKRRLQNCRNQRAHRARKRQEIIRAVDSGRPYDLVRWRIDTQTKGKGHESETDQRETRKLQPVLSISNYQSSLIHHDSSMYPLSVDHMFLPLVRENVFRGLWLNKIILRRSTEHYIPPESPAGAILPSTNAYPGHAALLVTSDIEIPRDIAPTHLQRAIAHCTMIDNLPFPRMRDNMIRAHEIFDHQELVEDLIGIIIDSWKPTLPTGRRQDKSCELRSTKGDDVVGMKLWGDPHTQSSWEVTPGFARKWGWLLEGCDELIRSTNVWRATRSERPLFGLTGAVAMPKAAPERI